MRSQSEGKSPALGNSAARNSRHNPLRVRGRGAVAMASRNVCEAANALGKLSHAMRNIRPITRCAWPLRYSLSRVPRAGIVTTLLILATFGGVATVAMAVIDNPTPSPDVAPTSFTADRGEPDKSRAADRPRIDNPLWAIPIRELAATQDRPLFLPSRRPPSPPVVTIASAPPAPPLQPKPAERERPPLLLIGTVAGEIGPIGIFLDQSTNRTISLRTGQRLYGWVLSAVHKREVILRKDEAIVLLPFSAHAIAPVAVATPISAAEREQHGRR